MKWFWFFRVVWWVGLEVNSFGLLEWLNGGGLGPGKKKMGVFKWFLGWFNGAFGACFQVILGWFDRAFGVAVRVIQRDGGKKIGFQEGRLKRGISHVL